MNHDRLANKTDREVTLAAVRFPHRVFPDGWTAAQELRARRIAAMEEAPDAPETAELEFLIEVAGAAAA